jgi:hypothetical protein
VIKATYGATNLPLLCQALKAYERRMWIEEMSGEHQVARSFFYLSGP